MRAMPGGCRGSRRQRPRVPPLHGLGGGARETAGQGKAAGVSGGFRALLREEERYTDLKWVGAAGWDGIRELLFTHAIIVGRVGQMSTYEDRWCYATREKAQAALAAWDGNGEPDGWHRHPNTGRRRQDGSAAKEEVEW